MTLELTTDEDDPADTASKIKAAAGSRSVDDALAAAWMATRDRFRAWVEREESAAQAERADDLDSALADAEKASAPPARLSELARSEYPKVRAMVAAHTSTPPEALAALAQDKERTVRAAAAANPRTPGAAG